MNRADILQGLRNLGVRSGMMLEVHSSLSSFGHIEGGADTLLAALMEALGNAGAIVMPSFLLSAKLPLTDEDKQLGLTSKYQF